MRGTADSIVYALFDPINRKYAPTLERVRVELLNGLFDKRSALNFGTFVKRRFDEDIVGVNAGPEIDVLEISVVAYRVMDLINKTPLKCFFIGAFEWYNSYPNLGFYPVDQLTNLFKKQESRLKIAGPGELLSLQVAEPTINAIVPYLSDENIVNNLSAMCAMVLLACLVSAGNRRLEK